MPQADLHVVHPERLRVFNLAFIIVWVVIGINVECFFDRYDELAKIVNIFLFG